MQVVGGGRDVELRPHRLHDHLPVHRLPGVQREQPEERAGPRADPGQAGCRAADVQLEAPEAAHLQQRGAFDDDGRLRLFRPSSDRAIPTAGRRGRSGPLRPRRGVASLCPTGSSADAAYATASAPEYRALCAKPMADSASREESGGAPLLRKGQLRERAHASSAGASSSRQRRTRSSKARVSGTPARSWEMAAVPARSRAPQRSPRSSAALTAAARAPLAPRRAKASPLAIRANHGSPRSSARAAIASARSGSAGCEDGGEQLNRAAGDGIVLEPFGAVAQQPRNVRPGAGDCELEGPQDVGVGRGQPGTAIGVGAPQRGPEIVAPVLAGLQVADRPHPAEPGDGPGGLRHRVTPGGRPRANDAAVSREPSRRARTARATRTS